MPEASTKEWETRPLGEIAQMRRGITYDSSQIESDDGGIAYVNMKSFLKGGGFNLQGTKAYTGPYSPADLIDPNDILIANTDVTAGDIVGVAALLPPDLRTQPALFSHHVTRFRLQHVIRSDFLYYLLCIPEYRRQMLRIARGTTVLMLDMHALKRVPVRFPKRQEAQRRIAEILSTIDDAIAHTEALIAKTQAIKAGLMQVLFTRGVTPDGKLRPPREQVPCLYKQSPLGWIPKDWEVTRIDGCGSVKLGRQRSPAQLSGRWAMPYLRVANVFDGYIDSSDILTMDFTPEERRTFSLRPGDILLNEGQSLELVGRAAVYDRPEGEMCFQNTLIRFRPLEGHVSSFYRWLFKRYLDSGRFMTIAKQTTSVAHLGADRFARMLCPRVSSGEQERIAAFVAVVQSAIDEDTAALGCLRQQKQGLMQDLLTGRVRALLPGESLEPGPV